MVNPRFPVYIPSKSRAEVATTPRELDRLGVPYTLVVEEEQFDDYARRWGEDRILVLDPKYQRDYVTCEDLGKTTGLGPGPVRNFCWDHAISQGHDWFWAIDDNIMVFYRQHQNHAYPVGDGTIFHAMEEFATRYKNTGMVGPEYKMFVPARQKLPPFRINRKLWSCYLIRTALPLRFECIYNDDVDIILRLMKSGWITVTFQAFLQDKITTQQLPGGSTEHLYEKEGTLEKSRAIVRRHPDVARVTWRFKRWHHYVDYSGFQNMQLLPDPEYVPSGVTYNFREIEQPDRIYAGIQRYGQDRGYAPPGGRQ